MQKMSLFFSEWLYRSQVFTREGFQIFVSCWEKSLSLSLLLKVNLIMEWLDLC